MIKKNIVAIIAIHIAFLLMFYGIKKEEVKTYWIKAINICTQCIGIG